MDVSLFVMISVAFVFSYVSLTYAALALGAPNRVVLPAWLAWIRNDGRTRSASGVVITVFVVLVVIVAFYTLMFSVIGDPRQPAVARITAAASLGIALAWTLYLAAQLARRSRP